MISFSFLQNYVDNYDPCTTTMLLFSCKHAVPVIYFVIVLSTLLFYFYLGIKMLRSLNANIKKLSPEFKFCMVTAIRQTALYFKYNIILYRPHSIFRTQLYKFNIIQTSLYYLCNSLFALELLRCLKKICFPFANLMFWIGVGFLWMNVGKICFDTILFCTQIDTRNKIVTKILNIYLQFNDKEYYIMHGFCVIILSIIFIFSTSIQALTNNKYRFWMKVVIFMYVMTILLNLIDTPFYNSKKIQVLILNYPKSEISKYIRILIIWIGEQAVCFIQAIVVYSLTIPNFVYQEVSISDELFSQVVIDD